MTTKTTCSYCGLHHENGICTAIARDNQPTNLQTTYAEQEADKIWGKIVNDIHDGAGASAYKLLKDAIQAAVNEGEALAYAKRNARI